MKTIICIVSSLIITAGTFSASAQDKNDPVLMKISEKDVLLSEFLNIYNKNNNVGQPIDQKSIDEYLELFINFKLKVKEAEEMGLDTTKAFTNELSGYRKQLAQPYLIDKKVNQGLIKEAHERMQWDVKASHILIRVAPDASPKDTLKAYNKVMSANKRIARGEDFSVVAAEVSEDPSAKDNKGDLGYFTAFYMVYPFETAAFNTDIGKVAKPIRTRFGYHLIKVYDKRKNRGEIKVAHIMVKTTEKADDQEKNKAAEQKIREIQEKLKKGESFEELAKTHSDDKGSGQKGGELPRFGTGRMVPEFEDAAFALKSDGDITEPVQTQFGWHIIKRVEAFPIGSFDELKSQLKSKVSRDMRASRSKESLLKNIKKEYGFKPVLRERDDFYRVMGDSFAFGKWDRDKAAKLNATVFKLSDSKYSKKTQENTQQGFADFLKKNTRLQKEEENLRKIINKLFDQWVDEQCLAFEESILEYKYPEFKALMQEYRDGILLFELMDDKVWSKAVKDTSGLDAFYKQNSGKFMWEKRLDASIFTCANEDVAKEARKLAKKQEKKGWSDKYILDNLNAESQLNLKIESKKFSKGDSETADKTNWQLGMTDNWLDNGKVIFVLVRKILQPQPKMLKEAKGLITAEYQSYLEEQWIKDLRAKYPVEVKKEVLSQIKKQ